MHILSQFLCFFSDDVISGWSCNLITLSRMDQKYSKHLLLEDKVLFKVLKNSVVEKVSQENFKVFCKLSQSHFNKIHCNFTLHYRLTFFLYQKLFRVLIIIVKKIDEITKLLLKHVSSCFLYVCCISHAVLFVLISV